MKKISVKNDFFISDIGKEDNANLLISKLDIGSTSEIELDLRHCIIDYPFTSKVIDKIIFDLDSTKTSKTLHIILSYSIPKLTLLNWLFIGSRYFSFSEGKELLLTEIEGKISTKVKQDNLKMNIKIINRQEEETANFIYGN